MKHGRRRAGVHQVFSVSVALLVVLMACGPTQPAGVTSVPAGPTAAGQSPDAIATGVAEALAQTQAATTPISVPAGAAWFSDDFSGTALAAGWAWIREDPASWTLTERPGWLRISTSTEPLLGAGGGAAVLVHDSPDGDFEVRTRLEFSPSVDFQFAGILIYFDDDHFVSLGRAFCGAAGACPGDGVYLDNDESLLAGQATVLAKGNPPAGPIWLRLAREGTTYSGDWSSDGDAWSPVGTTTASFDPTRLGILVTTGGTGAPSAPAYFDLFQVLPLAEIDVKPAGVCQESMASLQFVSNGVLASGWFLVTLSKTGGFEASEYRLLVNGQPSDCSILSGNTNRIYCTGPYLPPTGLIPIQLQSADGSCTFETPFDAMSVIPTPKPPPTGPYY
jgi:hypothetical protein